MERSGVCSEHSTTTRVRSVDWGKQGSTIGRQRMKSGNACEFYRERTVRRESALPIRDELVSMPTSLATAMISGASSSVVRTPSMTWGGRQGSDPMLGRWRQMEGGDVEARRKRKMLRCNTETDCQGAKAHRRIRVGFKKHGGADGAEER